MSNGQYSLLNTRGMSSAREMRKLKRDRVIKQLGIERKGVLAKQPPDFIDAEFHIADESRWWAVKVGECPKCQHPGPHCLNVIKKPYEPDAFFISCRGVGCNQRGPAFSSSKLAVQNWRLIAALRK